MVFHSSFLSSTIVLKVTSTVGMMSSLSTMALPSTTDCWGSCVEDRAQLFTPLEIQQFKSDSSSTYKGFQAEYHAVGKPLRRGKHS